MGRADAAIEALELELVKARQENLELARHATALQQTMSYLDDVGGVCAAAEAQTPPGLDAGENAAALADAAAPAPGAGAVTAPAPGPPARGLRNPAGVFAVCISAMIQQLGRLSIQHERQMQ